MLQSSVFLRDKAWINIIDISDKTQRIHLLKCLLSIVLLFCLLLYLHSDTL